MRTVHTRRAFSLAACKHQS